MKKLMLIYYNIVAVLTILYLFDELWKFIHNKPRMARCDSWRAHPSDYIWDGSCEEEVSR